jgi:hypothetical protein
MTVRAAPGPEAARVSPELALVDPDLARRLRQWLPAPRRPRRPPLPELGSEATPLRRDGRPAPVDAGSA